MVHLHLAANEEGTSPMKRTHRIVFSLFTVTNFCQLKYYKAYTPFWRARHGHHRIRNSYRVTINTKAGRMNLEIKEKLGKS
jgi:hypothetical protein